MTDEIKNNPIQFALRAGVNDPKKHSNIDIELASNAEKLARSKKTNEREAGRKLLEMFANNGNAIAEKTLDDIKERTEKFKPIRELGAKKNKEKADENHALILKMNEHLLKNIETARWSLDKRAEFIFEKEIKQINGKLYSERTIKNIITGK
ncbi:hypothetical protein MCEREM3_00158 [Methylophilaceae bacterium]